MTELALLVALFDGEMCCCHWKEIERPYNILFNYIPRYFLWLQYP